MPDPYVIRLDAKLDGFALPLNLLRLADARLWWILFRFSRLMNALRARALHYKDLRFPIKPYVEMTFPNYADVRNWRLFKRKSD
jgi:hypothetical protein